MPSTPAYAARSLVHHNSEILCQARPEILSSAYRVRTVLLREEAISAARFYYENEEFFEPVRLHVVSRAWRQDSCSIDFRIL